jgi:hypothetical protein
MSILLQYDTECVLLTSATTTKRIYTYILRHIYIYIYMYIYSYENRLELPHQVQQLQHAHACACLTTTVIYCLLAVAADLACAHIDHCLLLLTACRFRQVTTAHKALTDSRARRNYELYGHPDGPQVTSTA